MKNISASNEQLPLVTVITATYNLIRSQRADYIRQCIESVRAQSYPRIEHIVIDGASTDGTLELLREYEEKGWLTIYSEPDKGIYDAFNKGLQRANGKYIAYLNSDDFWHDSKGVECSVRMLEKHQADFSYAPYLSLREGKKTYEIDIAVSSFIYAVPCCHQTMFTRTDLLRQIGGFNLKYIISADRDSMVRLLLMGAKPVFVPLTFTSFRACGFSQVHWKDEQETYAAQLDELYRTNFLPLIGDEQRLEEELQRFKRRGMSPATKNALKERLHPDVYKELDVRCQWYAKEGEWHFLHGGRTWGFLGYRAKNMLMRILNFTIPRWEEKWRRLRGTTSL